MAAWSRTSCPNAARPTAGRAGKLFPPRLSVNKRGLTQGLLTSSCACFCCSWRAHVSSAACMSASLAYCIDMGLSVSAGRSPCTAD